MHRFWAFPLILGTVGLLLPVVTLVQAWAIFCVCVGRPIPLMRWYLWGGLLDMVPRLIAAGTILGLLMGLAEMERFRGNDRNGMRLARRLFGNVLWLGVYALFVAVSFALVMLGLQKEGYLIWLWFWRSLSDFLAISLLIVNLLAILWATIRTITAEDVLSPRVLAGKWWASNSVIE